MRVAILALLVLLCSCSDKTGGWLSTELPEPKVDFADSQILAEHHMRGQYLVNSVGACGFCHAKDLGGRRAPNISSDKEAGIGSWTLEQFVKVIKGGQKPDGKRISSKTHKGMSWISDRDARSIGIYLLSSKPVNRGQETKPKELMAKFNIFDGNSTVQGYVVTPKENANASFGRYLTLNIASCSTCHGSDSEKLLSGIEDQVPSLRKVGASWTKEQIVNFLSSGKNPSNTVVSARDCPWGYYRYSSILDKQAIALFLKTLS